MTVCDGLDGAGEPFDLAGIIRAGRGDMHREQVPQVYTAVWMELDSAL